MLTSVTRAACCQVSKREWNCLMTDYLDGCTDPSENLIDTSFAMDALYPNYPVIPNSQLRQHQQHFAAVSVDNIGGGDGVVGGGDVVTSEVFESSERAPQDTVLMPYHSNNDNNASLSHTAAQLVSPSTPLPQEPSPLSRRTPTPIDGNKRLTRAALASLEKQHYVAASVEQPDTSPTLPPTQVCPLPLFSL